MSSERRILLIVLAVVAAGSLIAVVLSAGLAELSSARTELALLEGRYARVSALGSIPRSDLAKEVSDLRASIAAEQRHYYSPGEMDPYRFGSEVRSLLGRHGIVVQEFRTTSGPTGTLLDFTTTGSPQAVAAFLADVSSGPKYFAVPYLHIQATPGRGSLTCEFQIGYLTHEAAK